MFEGKTAAQTGRMTGEGVQALVSHVASLRVLPEGARAQMDLETYDAYGAQIKAGSEAREQLTQWMQTIGPDRLYDLIQLDKARSKGDL
jgi:hypothetical protein